MAQPGRTAQSNGRHTGSGELDVLAEPPHELDQRACLCTRAFSQPLAPSPTDPSHAVPVRTWHWSPSGLPALGRPIGCAERQCRRYPVVLRVLTDWGLVSTSGPPSTTPHGETPQRADPPNAHAGIARLALAATQREQRCAALRTSSETGSSRSCTSIEPSFGGIDRRYLHSAHSKHSVPTG